MKRRAFLGLTGAAAARLGLASLGRAQTTSGPPNDATAPGELRLAGMSLAELRQGLYDQLFQVLLPFWDKHGIDHEYGGLMCSLDYDGTLLDTGKNLWFLGRGIWVYSFLYNHFGNNPQFLEVAKKTKEFVFKYARQGDGWWAEELSREGKVQRPFSGDTEGMYHLAEGLHEYAAASGDEQSREAALAILNKLFRDFDSPSFRYRGADFPYLWGSKRAIRPQGLWFLRNPSCGIIEAGRAIEVRAPIELIEAPFHPAFALGDRLQHLEARGNNFLADAVPRNDCDPIAPHAWSSGVSGSRPAAERAFRRRPKTRPFHITRLATWNGKE